MKTSKLFLVATFFLTFAICAHAQMRPDSKTYLPKFALKTNALYWATTTLNLGFEVGLAPKLTLDVSGNYNPWKFSDNRQLKHWLVQPELRYWLCERFNGSFFGLHGHYGEVNVSNLDIFDMGHYRYDGKVYGAGISYGYQWILGRSWSMEAVIGVGYARLDYDKYECGKCGEKLGHNTKNYFGPTKAAISFIYLIK